MPVEAEAKRANENVLSFRFISVVLMFSVAKLQTIAADCMCA